MRAAVSRPAPTDEFEDGECYGEDLVAHFLTEYTSPGDLVFDPFAGSGTTLVAAERLGRRPLGLEIHADRVELIRARLADPGAIRHADALRIRELGLPPIDFCISSPPYLTAVDHPENPLTGYQTLDGDYDRYLVELTDLYEGIAGLLRPGGRIVINVADLVEDGHRTPLATDVRRALSTVLRLEREILLDWDEPAYWCEADYCLVYVKDR